MGLKWIDCYRKLASAILVQMPHIAAPLTFASTRNWHIGTLFILSYAHKGR